jgi:hypothetical protein
MITDTRNKMIYSPLLQSSGLNRFQVCCDESYVCGYYLYKYLVPKTCKKEYCTYDKVPKYKKVCITKYGYKKVCKDKHYDGYGNTTTGYRLGEVSDEGSSSQSLSVSSSGSSAAGETVRSGYDSSYGSGYDTGYDKKKQYCTYEKYSYPYCYPTTEYDYVKKCKYIDYDCSYYAYKKVPKYCKKFYCGPFKYGSADGYTY